MTHEFILTAPEDLPYVDIQRDFDAPVEKLWIAHRGHAVYYDMAARNQMTQGDVDFSVGVVEGYRKFDEILATL